MHIYSHTVIPPLLHIDHLHVQPHNIQQPPHTITTTTYDHHHHTVQVAMCAYSFVCMLVNVYSKEKCHQCKLQQAMTTMSASGVVLLVDERKNHHQYKLHSVKTILGTSIEVHGMQQPNAACTRASP